MRIITKYKVFDLMVALSETKSEGVIFMNESIQIFQSGPKLPLSYLDHSASVATKNKTNKTNKTLPFTYQFNIELFGHRLL